MEEMPVHPNGGGGVLPGWAKEVTDTAALIQEQGLFYEKKQSQSRFCRVLFLSTQ